jgi:hypothetical protein
MEPPAPDELREWQAHRAVSCLAPGAFGSLLIPKDHLLAITREESPMGDGSAAHVPGQVHQDPVPIGIALADVHIPLGAAERVQHVVHLLEARPLRDSELPLLQPLVNGRQQLAPEQRHDHPHRQ